MNPELQKVIDKITKLRALSQSDNLNEAAAAAAAAERLLQEHRLSEADLEASSPSVPHEAPEEDPDPLYESGTKFPAWQWSLASRLGYQYGVSFWVENKSIKTWVKTSTYPYGHFEWPTYQRLRMVGRKSDVEITRYQYAYLSLEITRLTEAFGKMHKFAKGEARTARNSFRIGAVDGVIAAMRDANHVAQKAATQRGSSSAMVLVNRREESKQLMGQLHPNLRSRQSSGSRVDGAAYAEGRIAGAAIRQGASLGNNNVTRALKK